MKNNRNRKAQGINATGLQIRRAWEGKFGETMTNETYTQAANDLVAEMGFERAAEFVLSQSNDPFFTTEAEAARSAVVVA